MASNSEIGLTLKLISLALRDRWLEYNDKVASSKGYRPVWKVTTHRKEDGTEDVYVDDFQGLLVYQKEIDKLADRFLNAEPSISLPDIQ